MPESNSSFLKITLLTGIILFLFAGLSLSVFYLIERSGSRITRKQDSFSGLLRDFDSEFEVLVGLEREFNRLNNELDKLEKKAISVESWLSIIKRRRAIARMHPDSAGFLKKSINNALSAYPASMQLMAISIENLISDGAITADKEPILRNRLSYLNEISFNDLRLSSHILLGDFKDPNRASIVPPDIFTDGNNVNTMNLALLKIINSDYRSTVSMIQLLSHSPSLSENDLRFLGEYHYDFGDLARSAEYFHRIGDARAIIREADALYLSGYENSARRLWLELSDTDDYSEKSFYNLAVTADNLNESLYYLEKLVKTENFKTDAGQYGIVRYSRLLDDENAIKLLTEISSLSKEKYPFVALEAVKRQLPYWSIEKQIAQTWYLLDRHPENEDLYKWAGRLILYLRNYEDIQVLLGRHEMADFSSYWQKQYRAITDLFEGNIESADVLLRELISAEKADWSCYANMGRIMEALRMYSRAIEYYEKACDLSSNNKTKAAIMIRLSRCYTAIGRPADTLHSLQYVLELDPGNLTARMELDRFLY